MASFKLSILSFLGRIGEKAGSSSGSALDDYMKGLNEKVLAAGEPEGLTPASVLGIQLVSAIVLPLVAAFIIVNVPTFDFLHDGPQQIIVYLGIIAFGFYFPVMNMNERIGRRHRSIALQLPDALDLLTISVEAGLDFMTAMKRVVEKQPSGPLRDELERFFRQIELGRTRREALREMANRVQLADLSTVVSSLIQADRLGASIGPILRVQSDMARTRRGQRAEKSAQEAPVKMLAPLIICIFPAVFIMIFAPIIIQMIQDVSR